MKRNIKKKNLRTASVSAIGARRVDSTDASAQSEADSIAAVLQSRDKGPRAMNGTTFIYDFSGVTGELGPIIVISPAVHDYIAVVSYRGEVLQEFTRTGTDRRHLVRAALESLKLRFTRNCDYQKATLFMIEGEYMTEYEFSALTTENEPATDEERLRWIRRDTDLLWHVERELRLLAEAGCGPADAPERTSNGASNEA